MEQSPPNSRQLRDGGPWMKRSSRTHPFPSQASEPVGEATSALLQDEPSSPTTPGGEEPTRTGSSKRRLLNINGNTSVNVSADAARDEEVQSPSRSYSAQLSLPSTPGRKPILRNAGDQTMCVEFGCPDSPSRRLSWRDLHTNEALTEVSHYEPSETGYSDDERKAAQAACCVIS